MNVREMKSLNLDPDEKRSLGSDEGITLKLKTVRNWFGKDKSHAGVSLEDASGEWISAAVFNAPTEIAKMEGEWIPIEPTPGQMSGVWCEGESYVPRQGPNAGKEVRQVGLKIMGGCFRWDKASSDPPGASQSPAPAQGTSPPQKRAQGGGGAVERQGHALPLAEYQRWWLGRWEWYENSPAIQRAISRGEAVARTIRDAIGAEWMSQPPTERDIERSPYGGVPSSRQDGPDEEERAAYRSGPQPGDDDDDIPF